MMTERTGVRLVMRAITLAACLLFLAAGTALSTEPFPYPTSADFESPIKAFTGRILDSTITAPIRVPYPRSYYARGAELNKATNIFYFQIGDGRFVGYDIDSLLSQVGNPSNRRIQTRPGITGGESYLPWTSGYDVHPDQDGKWETPIHDSDQRLFDFAYDDRDYVYLAFSRYGWGVVKDNGSFQFVRQYINVGVGENVTTPQRVVSFKDGTDYYVILGNETGSQGDLWRVTDPANAQFIRSLPFGVSRGAMAKSGSTTMVALVGQDGKARIFRSNDLAQNRVGQEFSPSSGLNFRGIATDGANFFGVQATTIGTANIKISVFKPVSGGSSTYGQSVYSSSQTLKANPVGIEYGADSLVVWGPGSTGFSNAEIYRLENLVPKRVPINRKGTSTNFFESFYRGLYTGPIAKPALFSHGGKTYLQINTYGLADVYEIEAVDRVSVTVDTGAGYGTENPNAPAPGDGPYPGDPVTFKSNYPGTPSITVDWNFGNPDSGSSNTTTSSGTATKVHQYAGLSTAGEITSTKTVTVTEVGNSVNTDNTTVTLLVPEGRIGVGGTDIEFPGATPATAPIVFGDDFIDKSDGSVESHFNVWTRSAVETKGTPLETYDVGTCGVGSLDFVAHYVPYTGAGASITPTLPDPADHYLRNISVTNYEVKPFRAALEISTSNSTTITFRNATRINPTSGAFASGSSTPWTVKWTLVPPATDPNNPGNLTETDNSTIGGTPATFVVDKSAIAAGARVIMKVTMSSGDITETSCQPSQYLTGSAEMTLNPPDPQIAKTGCATVGASCTFTATSISGMDRSDWSYQWKRDGSNVGTNSATYSPNFSAGSYAVSVVVTNSITSTPSNTINLTVDPPACATGLGSEGLFTFDVSCTSSCTAGSAISFTINDFYADYSFGDCDSFEWNFGDGTTSTLNGRSGRATSHAYSSNGTYSARVTIRNDNGESKTMGPVSITVGSGPPPPSCPTKAPPNGQIFPSHSCPGGTCDTNDTIQFTASGFPYQLQSCDTYQWMFGDGTTSTSRNPTHKYSSPGTYTVSLKVTNSLGNSTGTESITVASGTGDPCPLPESNKVFPEYSCPGGTCEIGETVTFSFSTGFGGVVPDTCLNFLWDFDDGTTSTTRLPTHAYSGGGTFKVTVTLSNSTSQFTTAPFEVTIAGDPVDKPTGVTISANSTNPIAGITAIEFTGNATGGDPVTTWSWKFGDNKSATGKTVTHTYATSGTFTVTLTASNAGGSSQATLKIDVAEESVFRFLIPGVISADGANQSKWRTDIQGFIPNISAENPLTLDVDFTGCIIVGNLCQPAVKTVTLVIDSSTFIIEDFVKAVVDAAGGTGTIIVEGNSPNVPQMWTRTYNVSPTGVGTFGQLIPAILLTGQQNAEIEIPALELGGLQNSPRFRTNVGFVNATSSAVTLRATVYDETIGLRLGTFDVPLSPFALDQRGITQWLPGIPSSNNRFSIRIENPAGKQVYVYASMIDNISNDPVFIPAIPDGQINTADSDHLILPGVGHFGPWRSDMTIFNPDSETIVVDIAYIDSAGVKKAEVLSLPIASKATIGIDDVLKSGVINPVVAEDSIGTIEVMTRLNNALFPVVFARTYNDQQANGTYGQGIPAFAKTQANLVANKPAYIPGVRNDSAYYTNLGLVSLRESGSTTVIVELLDPINGSLLAARPVELGALQSTIIPRVLEQFLFSVTSHGTIKLEIVSGGPVWAYGSSIDKLTFDPEYIPAVPAN